MQLRHTRPMGIACVEYLRCANSSDIRMHLSLSIEVLAFKNVIICAST